MRRKFFGHLVGAVLDVMLKKILPALLLVCWSASWADVPLRSAHALVVDDNTGEVLLEKYSDIAVPIASLTKLMTAMVVLDAGQAGNQLIRIENADTNALGYRNFGLPVGAFATRRSLVELALMSSDNHAAVALARAYPGGFGAFQIAVAQKIRDLGLTSTFIEEPTGLSPKNRASAMDIAKIVRAASTYPDIVRFTTQSRNMVEVRGRKREYHNTNRFVGAPGWNILLSKTGFTNPAGRCVAMRMQAEGRTFTVVLLGAWAKSQRARDAVNVRRWLGGGKTISAKPARSERRAQFTKAVFQPRQHSSAGRLTASVVEQSELSLKLDGSMPVQAR